MSTSDVVRVAVVEGQETIHTSVTRDLDDCFYELPAHLVAEYEAARDRWEQAQEAIVRHINDNGLEPQDVDPDNEEQG